MTLKELDDYFKSFLNLENYSSDISKNGIQVENNCKEITKVAFAVDACAETINRAANENCQVLFVHHGLFWGHEETITGSHYKRISALIKNNIALYACHAPLDANPYVGNNYGLAKRLNLEEIQPFAYWRDMLMGVIGDFEKSKSIDEVIKLLFSDGNKPYTVLPFGKKEIQKVVIISGGGGSDLSQAIKANADLFITGDFPHEQYHVALENQINVIAGGHYQTETIGVQSVAQKLKQEKGIETVFIDVPTGL